MLDVAHPTWIEIDINQLRSNIKTIKSYIGNVKFCLPVKANAYGHGLVQIAKAASLENVDYLAVAHLSEAVKLRNAGLNIQIFVMGAIHEDQVGELISHNVEFTISSMYKADLVAKYCKNKNLRCSVHLEIDTGMQRTGVRPSSAIDLYAFVKSQECFDVKGIYSHFATADNPNDSFALEQISLVNEVRKNPIFSKANILWHMANSSGVLFYPQSLLDMVRPSLISFGYVPSNAPDSVKSIRPCFSLKSKISYFKVVEAGSGISYGRTYVTPKCTRVVTIPVGYGDGFRRSLSGKAYCLIRGKKYPIVGSICMDQCMVDIGDDEAYVGDEVVLIGRQGAQRIDLIDLAEACNTIPYEILCAFNERIPRIYL